MRLEMMQVDRGWILIDREYLIPPPAPIPLLLECILTDKDTEQENADVD